MMRRTRLAALAALVLATSGCSATTESTEVGVRVRKVGILQSRGVVPEVYPQGGTYFFFRALSDWHVFDIAIQNLVMVREADEGDRGGDDSLRFKTIDGNDVSVNVTVQWSLTPSKAPYILQHVGGSTAEVEEKLVRPVSRAVIRDVLNQLTSEEYYQADRRFKVAEVAREQLNRIFEAEGMVVQQILLGEHKFNPTYEQMIRDKKVAEQEGERLISETEAAGAEMERDLQRAKGEVGREIEKAIGEAAKRKLEADALYFERQKQAEALLAEKKAKAEGLTAQAKALAGSGGTQMVKLEIARALQGKRILFLPAGEGMDVRTTDMNTLLQSFGIQQGQKDK